jgi:hypothetical protein
METQLSRQRNSNPTVVGFSSQEIALARLRRRGVGCGLRRKSAPRKLIAVAPVVTV